MEVCFGDDLYPAGSDEALKSLDDVWAPSLGLFDKSTGDRKGKFETFVSAEAFFESGKHWTIRFFGDLFEDALVVFFGIPIFVGPVLVVATNGKDTVLFHPVGLVHM